MVCGCSEKRKFVPSGKWVEEGTWKGHTETSLLERSGPPTRVNDSYVRIGRRPWPPPGTYRSLMYEIPDGYLWLWFRKENGVWVCFDSLWFNRDVQL